MKYLIEIQEKINENRNRQLTIGNIGKRGYSPRPPDHMQVTVNIE